MSGSPAPSSSPPPLKSETTPARRLPVVLVGAFIVGHVVLALLMRAVPLIGAVHAAVCMLMGVFIALRYSGRYVTYVVAYVMGAEVLWRMAKAAVIWELGKYTVVLVLVVGLSRLRVRRNIGLALGYFLLLTPSVLLTLGSGNFNTARQLISFNLSGPLSLALCVLFFSNTKITADDLRRVFLTVLGPLAGIAALGVFSLATHEHVEFVNASNYVAAGEFGANQVSAALGLGVLLALLLVIDRKNPVALRVGLGVLAVMFAAQAAITFSRSGLALAFSSLMAFAFYMVRDSRARITLATVALVVFAIGKYVVVPQLDDFTNGKFGERYSEFESDGRTKLAGFDIAVFEEHPLIGVGPGMANVLREEMGHFGASHTEYTRLLAEHGVFGIAAMVMLAIIGLRLMRAARVLKYRALVAALCTWFALFLAVSGMRLVAPSVVLGLACTIAYSFVPPRRTTRARA